MPMIKKLSVGSHKPKFGGDGQRNNGQWKKTQKIVKYDVLTRTPFIDPLIIQQAHALPLKRLI